MPMSFTKMDSNKENVESAPAYSGTSDGNISFAKETLECIFASVVCLIIQFLTLTLPISMIIIGAIYLDECPLEKNIPIFLVVNGVSGLLNNIFGIIKSICCKRNTDEDAEEGAASKPGTSLSILISLFMTGWFIAGNVWVYGSHSDLSTNTASANYCHPTAYYFAFWMINVCYIFIGLIILLSCGCCVARWCKK